MWTNLMTLQSDHFEHAASLVASSFVWDGVWPLDEATGNGYDKLDLFKRSGWNLVSITLAGDNHNSSQALAMLAECRRVIAATPEKYLLVECFDDIDRIQREDKIGITLHFEGTRCFERNLDLVDCFYKLGVKHTLLAFNNSNSAAGGCMEPFDGGLTLWGRNLIREMERVGMMVDLSHVGRRSSLEALEMAARPMLFTHSNSAAIAPHPRNLTDEQIRKCAATGGLVGLSGASDYLGDPSASTLSMFRNLDHVVGLVGIEHVVIGFDIVFDADALNRWVRSRPDEWPMATKSSWPGFSYIKPTQLVELVEMMIVAGYSDDAVAAFLGGNYRRLAKAAWTAEPIRAASSGAVGTAA